MRPNGKSKKEPALTAAAALHMDSAQDEPITLDVDVQVTCTCGAVITKRAEICALEDWVEDVCPGCGAQIRVDVKTQITLSCSASQTSSAEW